jgi:hypothetical protein
MATCEVCANDYDKASSMAGDVGHLAGAGPRARKAWI